MLAPVIRSVIPYQWFVSHCDPSHTNAPLTPTISLLAASSLSLFEAWLVLVCVYQQTMSACQTSVRALETVLIMFCSALPCTGLIQLLEINWNSAVSSGIMQTMTHQHQLLGANRRFYAEISSDDLTQAPTPPQSDVKPECKNSSSFFVICKNWLGVNNLV